MRKKKRELQLNPISREMCPYCCKLIFSHSYANWPKAFPKKEESFGEKCVFAIRSLAVAEGSNHLNPICNGCCNSGGVRCRVVKGSCKAEFVSPYYKAGLSTY